VSTSCVEMEDQGMDQVRYTSRDNGHMNKMNMEKHLMKELTRDM